MISAKRALVMFERAKWNTTLWGGDVVIRIVEGQAKYVCDSTGLGKISDEEICRIEKEKEKENKKAHDDL
jgi:hypothetical protein